MFAFLGMQSPGIGLILMLEGVVFHISGQNAFLGQLLYIFWNFVLPFLFENAKLRIKTNNKQTKKQTSFFLGLIH